MISFKMKIMLTLFLEYRDDVPTRLFYSQWSPILRVKDPLELFALQTFAILRPQEYSSVLDLKVQIDVPNRPPSLCNQRIINEKRYLKLIQIQYEKYLKQISKNRILVVNILFRILFLICFRIKEV